MATKARKNPHAVALGRLGGRKGKRTPAQTRAARENGKKGGRPPKVSDAKLLDQGGRSAILGDRAFGLRRMKF